MRYPWGVEWEGVADPIYVPLRSLPNPGREPDLLCATPTRFTRLLHSWTSLTPRARRTRRPPSSSPRTRLPMRRRSGPASRRAGATLTARMRRWPACRSRLLFIFRAATTNRVERTIPFELSSTPCRPAAAFHRRRPSTLSTNTFTPSAFHPHH